MEVLLSWLALPIYVVQGLQVRKASIRLSPPEAPREIIVPGSEKTLKLLVIGDSSAAGVGVDDFFESVAGRLPFLVAEKTGAAVVARNCGNNSATAGDLTKYVVPNLERIAYDYVVINIGVNDVKNLHTKRRFSKEFGGLIYALRARFPGAKFIWSGIPDLSRVPILPKPLNWIMGVRGKILREKAYALCRERGVFAPTPKWEPLPENFSHDGFHASTQGYKVWAEETADYISSIEAKE